MSHLLDTIFKKNKYLSIMKIQINETFKKEVEIKLPTPKYVRFYDTVFYKFHEEGDNIITTNFDYSEVETSTYPFNLLVTTNLNLETFNAEDKTKYTVITGAEFYGKLQELLAKYSITRLTPNFDAPTVFLHEDNSITNHHSILR